MIQDENNFLKLINTKMNHEESIKILMDNGANQMTCVKVIKAVYKISLAEANSIIQNSHYLKKFKSGNDNLKSVWFS